MAFREKVINWIKQDLRTHWAAEEPLIERVYHSIMEAGETGDFKRATGKDASKVISIFKMPLEPADTDRLFGNDAAVSELRRRLEETGFEVELRPYTNEAWLAIPLSQVR